VPREATGGGDVVRRIPKPKLLRPRGGRGGPPRFAGLRLIPGRRALLAAAVASLLIVPGASATPPTITLTINGTLGSNGWYVTNVTANWTVTGAESSTGCDTKTLTADTPGTKLTCSATSGGDQTIVSKTFKVDKTAPAVTASPARAPDANGWYNHALAVVFAGRDATAGIAGCSSGSYAGPDDANASVSGSCSDLAGNVGSARLSLRYDATAPSLAKLRAKTGNRRLSLKWKTSPDTQRVQLTRAPGRRGADSTTVYSGPAASYLDTGLKIGTVYRYTATGFDQAGNSAAKLLAVTATGPLLSPVPGARVASAPRLAWTPVKGASYYNLQLVRGRKIYSAWPTSTHFRLPKSWVFNGHRYRLHKGVYRWYVWPGFGRFSASKYGGLLGGSSFVFSG
jgi:hypothetical protein